MKICYLLFREGKKQDVFVVVVAVVKSLAKGFISEMAFLSFMI